jgi:hypothetical protein
LAVINPRAALLLAAIAASHPAIAATFKIHIASRHLAHREYLADTRADNEANPGLGYEQDGGLEYGGYVNSENAISLYAVRNYYAGRYSVGLGVVTGYENPAPILPAVVLRLRAGPLEFGLLPGVTARGGVVPTVTVSLAFGR